MNDKEYIKSLESSWRRQQEFIDDLLSFNSQLLKERQESDAQANNNYAKMVFARQRLAIMAMRYARLRREQRSAS